jgi:hypothetical protein
MKQNGIVISGGTASEMYKLFLGSLSSSGTSSTNHSWTATLAQYTSDSLGSLESSFTPEQYSPERRSEVVSTVVSTSPSDGGAAREDQTVPGQDWEELLARVEDISLQHSLGRRMGELRTRLGSLQERAACLQDELESVKRSAATTCSFSFPLIYLSGVFIHFFASYIESNSWAVNITPKGRR